VIGSNAAHSHSQYASIAVARGQINSQTPSHSSFESSKDLVDLRPIGLRLQQRESRPTETQAAPKAT
jgi:hypothetical protein